MGTKDYLKLLQWLSIRITHDQHLLFLLTVLLASALTAIASNIRQMFVGRSMVIQSGTSLNKLKGSRRNQLRLLLLMLLL